MKIPKFLKRKRNIWIIAIVAVLILLGFFIFRGKNPAASIQTGTVAKQNLEQTVLSTGQVVSSTDLELGFQAGGVVRRVSVKEGDKVNSGQVLASLDQASALASLTSARGSLAQAQANYEKILEGITPENARIYEDAIVSAQHDLDSAYNSIVNTLNDAYTKMYNAYAVATTIQNTYFFLADQEGIRVQESKKDIDTSMQNAKKYLDAAQASASQQNIDLAVSQVVASLNNVFADLVVIRDQTDSGVYYLRVTATDKTSLDTQKGYINTALAAVTTAKQNIASYKIALQKAQHQLDLQKAPARQADIDLAQAQISSAQGQVDAANAVLNNLIIISPSAGTITEVDIKVGEQATAMKKAIVLQDVEDLHAEANVSEANIASVTLGQTVDYTFDALGPDKHFSGKVLSINPASTVISGVVDYEIKGSFENVVGVKPGMTANMTILVAQKDNALAVPSTAVILKNGKKYVRVIDDPKKITYHEVEVQAGLQADGGLVEIISGLSEGQRIVVYMK